MNNWTPRLITEGIVALLLLSMYQSFIKKLGWSSQTALIVIGSLLLIAGAAAFVTKPDEKFARLTGYASPKAQTARIVAYLVVGAALTCCGLAMKISN